MGFDLPNRRTFLSGVTAAVAGLAGCPIGGDSGDPQQSPANKVGNQQSSTSSQIPPHDHSGKDRGGASLSPGNISIPAFQQAPSYIIYKRDGEVRALNGRTEEVDFSDVEATKVVQDAIDTLGSGTIFIKQGEYRMGPNEIEFQSGIRVVGEGPGATVLKMKDGINGRRGQKRSSIFHIKDNVSDVTISNLEIDGNESNNRDVPPYPKSPHHHGIVVHGSGPQVATDDKPSNVTIRNVSVHDTVRSNIVLAGYNCTVENVWLANSASDHWLYMAGAEECTVQGVHASGFARNEGIVLGVGRRICKGNVLRDIVIEGATTTPYQSEPAGLGGRYPKHAINFRRSSGNASHNSVERLSVRSSETSFGHGVRVDQPSTSIDGLRYRAGLAQETGSVLNINPSATHTRVRHADVEIQQTGGINGSLPTVHADASDVTLTEVTISGNGNEGVRGIYVGSNDEGVNRTTIRDVKIQTDGPALTANGNGRPVTQLYVDNLQDLAGSGLDIEGSVDFAQRLVFS